MSRPAAFLTSPGIALVGWPSELAPSCARRLVYLPQRGYRELGGRPNALDVGPIVVKPGTQAVDTPVELRAVAAPGVMNGGHLA